MDAITYLGLGHAFPANMTGNTVLLGVAVARGDGTAGVRSAVALGGFSLGVIIGALIVGNRSWPARSASALLLESIVLLALLVGWGLAGSPSGAVRYLLLGGAGGAMGLQSIAARAASGGGVATTYVTGTLTNALASLSGRVVSRGPDSARAHHTGNLAGAIWLLYALGALGGALAQLSWHAAALVGPTTIVGLVSATAPRRLRG
jgi:uncharacterized membrane protein YoaK (UPF0700 family)